MHFSKFLSSLLAAGSLVVPSLCDAGEGYHLARRWVDQERRDLQGVIRSLDEKWAFERRSLVVQLRSLDPLGEVLFARAPPAKSPAKAPAPPSGGKEKTTEGTTPKVCSIKPGGLAKGKRSLVRRDNIIVEAGEAAQGTGFDQMGTWGLRTCIGIAASSTNATKRKAMAHLNGENLRGETYDVQLQNFRALVLRLGPGVKLTVSYPSTEEAPAHLRQTLGRMITDVEQFARGFDSNYVPFRRARGAVGAMAILLDGTVENC